VVDDVARSWSHKVLMIGAAAEMDESTDDKIECGNCRATPTNDFCFLHSP
jgi:hypothetical protein